MHTRRWFAVAFSFLAAGLLADAETMLEDIRETTKFTEHYTSISEIDKKVMDVLGGVDRSKFVPESVKRGAFLNQPLPIGYGQTISQPFIVALMTHVLDVQSTDRVLEIGTGSGYQAAVLAELAKDVYTIEIVEELAKSAEKRLEELEYANVSVKAGDGWFGWPDVAPFDKIIVTAVAAKIPPKLVEQLRSGGLLVMPVGDPEGHQDLVLAKKNEDGSLEEKRVLPVRFVPLTGEGVLTVPDRKDDETSL